MEKKIKIIAVKLGSLFPVLLLVFIDFSCKENDTPYIYKCQDGFIDFQNVANLSFIDPGNSADSLTTLVIQSEEQLNKYFRNARGKFDFKRNTLLAGRYRAPNEDAVLKQTVKSFCEYNVLYYDIQLWGGMLPTAVQVPFFALIPKIPDNTTVQFHVHY